MAYQDLLLIMQTKQLHAIQMPRSDISLKGEMVSNSQMRMTLKACMQY